MATERLRARVSRDFSTGADAAIRRLNALNLATAEKQSRERIQAAIVLLANGDSAQLEHYAEEAELDWRDVLVFSDLADEDWAIRLDAELGPPDIANPS
jgi:hypothetical protein